MPRLVIALLVLLCCAPSSAHAAARVTVISAAGSAAPEMVGGSEQSLEEPSRYLIADGCLAFGFCPVPTLRADPDETVTICVDGPVDEVVARAGDVIAAQRDATTVRRRTRASRAQATLVAPGSAPIVTSLRLR